jgi:hypothetical protein
MVTRKSLGALAVVTLVLFAVAFGVGTNHHGAVKVIGDVAWFGFVLCLLFLIVASVLVIVRNRRRVRGT